MLHFSVPLTLSMLGLFGGDAPPVSGIIKQNTIRFWLCRNEKKNDADNSNCSLGVGLAFLSGKGISKGTWRHRNVEMYRHISDAERVHHIDTKISDKIECWG